MSPNPFKSQYSLKENLEKAFIIVAGEGSINLDDEDPVHIAIVFDVQGYGPHGAAIYADQNRFHATPDTAMQKAYEILEQHELDITDEEYLKELQDEWGDEWMSIMTETYDAMTWTLSPKEAAEQIRGTKAEKFIDIYEED